MFFFNTHWPQLTAPFYSIHFETSICQFNSSKCSPITPDEVRETMRLDQSFIQNHSRSFRCTAPCWFIRLFRFPYSFSTGFRSEDWNGHSRSLVLCSVTHFCVRIIVWLEDPNMAHCKISNKVSHLFNFYLLVFDRIHVSKQDVHPCVHQTPLECLLLKS